VRVRDHVLLATGGAAALYPWLRRAVLVPWAASVLIDIDHYLWFCIHERRLRPLAALRFFNQAQPPQHVGTRLLHSPGVLLALALLSARQRWAQLLLLGMGFHAAMDQYHEMRLDQARQAALGRDRFTCQRCGAQGADIVAHLWRQPPLLPSYRIEHFVSLCARCHEKAHAEGTRYDSGIILWPLQAAYVGGIIETLMGRAREEADQ
jgi:hypothetical protein